MTEHPSQQQLGQYQSRALAPELFLSIHRHLDSCPECSERCNPELRVSEDYELLLAAVMPDPSEPAYHLTTAELRGFVKNDLDDVDAESAESHLAVCAECQQTAEALRTAEFGDTAVAGKVGETFPNQTEGAFGAFLTAQARPLMFAGLLAAIIGAALLVVFFVLKRESQSPRNDEKVNVNASTPSPTGGLRVEQPPKPGDPNPDSPQPNKNSSTSLGSNLDESNTPSPRADVSSTISPSLQRAIALAVQTKKLKEPRILAELAGAKSELLSDSGNRQPFLLLSPVGQVLSDRNPTFRWQALSGASSYQVTITDDKLDEVANSGQITNTEWKASLSLKSGAVYSWQVTAFKDGKRITSPVMPAPQAKFKILDRQQSEQLRRIKQTMPNNHLELGVFYTQAGLLDEAILEFQELQKDKSQAALAEKLLSSVRAMKK